MFRILHILIFFKFTSSALFFRDPFQTTLPIKQIHPQKPLSSGLQFHKRLPTVGGKERVSGPEADVA